MLLLRRLFYSAVMLSCFSLIHACGLGNLNFDNTEFPDYEPTMALPIGVSHYTMVELLEGLQGDDLSVEESESRFMTLVFSDTMVSTNRNAYLQLASFSTSGSLFPQVSEGPYGEVRQLEFEETYTYSLDGLQGERLDSVFFKEGELQLALHSNIASEVRVTFSIPSLTLNTTGTALYDTLAAPAGSTASSETGATLAGRKLALRVEGDNNHFDVVMKITVVLAPGETLRFSDFVGFSFSFAEHTYRIAHGFFGTKEVPLQDSFIDMSFFEKFGDSGIDFKEPLIRMLVSNAYGFPLGLSLAGLSATNNDSSTIALTGPASEALHYINYPANEAEVLRTTEIIINSENSNIKDLFSLTPTRFNLPLVTISNPTAFEAVPANFITDSSYMETITQVELPLEIKLDTFLTNLTYSLEGVELEGLQNAALRIHTINQIPLKATLAVSFADADGEPFHFLEERLALEAPPLDENGRTSSATSLLAEVHLGADGTDALKEAASLTVSIIIDSSAAANDDYVKLFADYEIVVSVSISGKLQITF